jgi:hypothetical protein
MTTVLKMKTLPQEYPRRDLATYAIAPAEATVTAHRAPRAQPARPMGLAERATSLRGRELWAKCRPSSRVIPFYILFCLYILEILINLQNSLKIE